MCEGAVKPEIRVGCVGHRVQSGQAPRVNAQVDESIRPRHIAARSIDQYLARHTVELPTTGLEGERGLDCIRKLNPQARRLRWQSAPPQ